MRYATSRITRDGHERELIFYIDKLIKLNEKEIDFEKRGHGTKGIPGNTKQEKIDLIKKINVLRGVR